MRFLRSGVIALLAVLTTPFFAPLDSAVEARELEVSGQILDEEGRVIAKARARLLPYRGPYGAAADELAGIWQPEPAAEDLAGPDGTYRLTVETPGFYRLEVSAPGYLPLIRNLRPLLEDVEIPTAELFPTGSTEVRILGADGEPVEGAAATVWYAGYRSQTGWNVYSFRRPHKIPAADDGTVQIPHSKKLPALVRAWAPGHLESSQDKLTGKKTLRLEGAKIQPVQVFDARKRPLAGVLARVGWGRFAASSSDEEGRLLIPAPSGEHSHPVQLLAEDGRRFGGDLRANPGENPEVDKVSLEDLVLFRASTLTEGSRDPIAGALVWWASDPEISTTSDRHGAFELAHPSVQPPAPPATIQFGAPGYFGQHLQLPGQNTETVLLQPSMSVIGRVVDEAGEPLEGVEVRATFERRLTQGQYNHWRSGGVFTSAADGTFRLHPMAPTTNYNLHLSKSGYSPVQQGITLPPLGEAFDLEVVLEVGRRAFGRVVDFDEQPIEGAEVRLRQQIDDPRQMMRFRHNTRTDDFAAVSQTSGRYDLHDLPPGRFFLEVRRSGFAPASVPGIEIPSVTGDEGFDLGTVALEPGVTLEGKVVDPEGEALAGVAIRLVEGDHNAMMSYSVSTQSLTTDEEGRFQAVDRRSGQKLDVNASLEGYLENQVSGVVMPPEKPLVITLQRSVTLRGRVVDASGTPVPRVSVSMMHEPDGGSFQNMGFLGQVATALNGAFEFKSVPPGALVQVLAQGSSLGKGELRRIKVPRDAPSLEGLEVVLQAGATVQGRVLNSAGEPVPQAQVNESSPNRAYSFNTLSTHTDAEGRYRLVGVSPGSTQIAVYHAEYQQSTKALEVQPGQNTLDFQLEGGQTVRGQVVAEGRACPGATIQILGTQGGGFGREVLSDHEGAFEMHNVPDGSFKVQASHPDYASQTLQDELIVAGAPVEGVLVELQRGATLVGELLGFRPEELSKVQVFAHTERDMRSGQVDFDARYRVLRLSPGNWFVAASGPDGRSAQGLITVDPGVEEVTLDLEVKEGYSVSGTVFYGEEAMDGAQIHLSGLSTNSNGQSRSDYQGQYLVRGLEAGRYRMLVLGHRQGLMYQRDLEVRGDMDLDVQLRGGRVSGWVFDAASGGPLRGVKLLVESLDQDGKPTGFRSQKSQTNAEGSFDLGELTPGRWQIHAEKDGFQRGETFVDVQSNVDQGGLEFRLETTRGLGVLVQGPDGLPFKETAWLALLSPQGTAVATEVATPDATGRVHFSTAPAGSWRLLASAAGRAPVQISVQVPEDTPTVRLVQGERATLKVPELGREPAIAHAQLTGPDGQLFRSLRTTYVIDRFPLRFGQANFTDLPVGTWNVVVTATDGRTWSGTLQVVQGQQAQLQLGS